MALEGDPTSGTFYIDDLNATYPAGSEAKSQGDDHLRLIKKAIKNTFPNIDAPITATDTELNYVDVTTLGTQEASKALTADANNTVTVPSGGEINFASGAKLEIGGVEVTASAAELNYNDITTLGTQQASKVLTADASNITTIPGTLVLTGTITADGDSISAAELSRLNGLSDDITTLLAAKQATITGAATTVDTEDLTASRALVSNSSGKIAVSTVTSTELGLLSGATSLGGTTQGTKATPTSVTNFSFTGIPSGTKRIQIALYDLSTDGADNVMLQLGDSGGAETTGYSSSCWQLDAAPTLTEYEDSAGFMLGFLEGGTRSLSGTITLLSLDSTGTMWAMSGVTKTSVSGFICAGHKTLSAALTQLKIYTEDGSGLFDAGSVNILYE